MDRAIVLVDHGSRMPEANALVERVAGAVRRRRRDLRVEVAHLELAEPTLPQALRRCAENGVGEVVVCPYFLGPGRHSSADIPRLVEQARREHKGLRVSVSDPLGFDERLVDVVLARIDAALG